MKLLTVAIFFLCVSVNGQLVDRFTKFPSAAPVTNLWITGDASSTDSEADDASQWTASCSASCVQVTSVANTDSQGGSFAIQINADLDSNRGGYVDYTRAWNQTPHTATVRIRRTAGTTQINNTASWTGVSAITYDFDFDSVSNGTWITGTVNFTPDATGTVRVRFNASIADGTVGGTLEISEIVITED